MKTFKFLTAIGTITLILASCTGKQGAPGAAGPQGAAGAQGPVGATGPMGNANVQDTTYTVTTWSHLSAYDYADLTDLQITTGIISNGEVLTFVSFGGGDWKNLNWTSLNPPGYTMTFDYSVGEVALYFAGSGGGVDPNTTFGIASIAVKVVCITNSAMKQHPKINWHDYSQVNAIIKMQNTGKD